MSSLELAVIGDIHGNAYALEAVLDGTSCDQLVDGRIPVLVGGLGYGEENVIEQLVGIVAEGRARDSGRAASTCL